MCMSNIRVSLRRSVLRQERSCKDNCPKELQRSSRNGVLSIVKNCLTTGGELKILSRSNEFRGLIMMISLLSARYLGERKFAVSFSDGSAGTLDMAEYLANRSGPLLEPLKDETYLSRGFVEAGAFAWPNGLELSPVKLQSLTALVKHAA